MKGYALPLALVGLGGAILLAARSASAKPRLLGESQSILLLGDSLAYGMMSTVRQLAESNGHRFIGKACEAGGSGTSGCSAVVGASSAQWATEAWLAPQLEQRPTLTIISLGTNDFKRGSSSAAQVASEAKAIVSKLQAAGSKVVWVAPPLMPFDDSAKARDAWRATGVPWFNTVNFKLPRSGDGIHLTGAGYASWAKHLWSWLGGL